jgi:hypothetical protein
MYSGIGDRGFTNDSKFPRCSPLLTLTAPISVIAAPFFGEAPVVSKSTITNVVSDRAVAAKSKGVGMGKTYLAEVTVWLI